MLANITMCDHHHSRMSVCDGYTSLSYFSIMQTPFLADLKPSGRFVMEDVQNIGGTPGLIKFLIDNDMFDGNQMTVTGQSHNENLADLKHPGLTPGQEIIRPLNNPIKKTGHLQMMYGNLCPGGGVAKITGKEGETFTVCLTQLRSSIEDSRPRLELIDFAKSTLTHHRERHVFMTMSKQ